MTGIVAWLSIHLAAVLSLALMISNIFARLIEHSSDSE